MNYRGLKYVQIQVSVRNLQIMKTDLRLNSVVPHGVGGGPESAAIDFIYMFMLRDFGQDLYTRIGINQIGQDLNEFVKIESKTRAHVNIRYPEDEHFEARTVQEKNRIRLEVIHSALLRLAKFDGKLDLDKLEAIKNNILDKNFLFHFVIKSFFFKKSNLVARLVVNPLMDKFVYELVIEENSLLKCRLHLYNGRTVVFFGEDFFWHGKWKSDKEFTLEGKMKEVKLIINIDKCEVEIINLTMYRAPHISL